MGAPPHPGERGGRFLRPVRHFLLEPPRHAGAPVAAPVGPAHLLPLPARLLSVGEAALHRPARPGKLPHRHHAGQCRHARRALRVRPLRRDGLRVHPAHRRAADSRDRPLLFPRGAALLRPVGRRGSGAEKSQSPGYAPHVEPAPRAVRPRGPRARRGGRDPAGGGGHGLHRAHPCQRLDGHDSRGLQPRHGGRQKIRPGHVAPLSREIPLPSGVPRGDDAPHHGQPGRPVVRGARRRRAHRDLCRRRGSALPAQRGHGGGVLPHHHRRLPLRGLSRHLFPCRKVVNIKLLCHFKKCRQSSFYLLTLCVSGKY